MSFQNVGEVIAERHLVRIDREPNTAIVVVIGKPQAFSNSSDFYCPFQILGIGSEKVKHALGADAIQALQLVMIMIGGDLWTLNKQCGGAIRSQDGSPNLGFPES